MQTRKYGCFVVEKGVFFSTDVCRAPDLGTGVSLYFEFVKLMAICFAVLTILSAPAMAFAFAGSRIPSSNWDAAGLYQLTLGNIGYDPASPTYAKDSACHKSHAVGGILTNTTCIHMPGGLEYSMEEVGSILTACEFLQILVFFCFIMHLQRRADRQKAETERLHTSACDFSIMVGNLPKDTTAQQLVAHFSGLYELDKPDWQGRPPLDGAQPVQSTDNSREPLHLNTWVAECVVHERIGGYIQAFKNQNGLLEELFTARARVKMYAKDSPHKYGNDPVRYAKEEKKLEAAMKKFEMFTQHVINTKKIVKDKKNASTKSPPPGAATPSADGGGDVEAPREKSLSITEAIDADAVAAFVIFEYSESMARCLEDYSKYSSFPRNICFPAKLKFRGRRITVKQAPEPDSIMWENLEVGWCLKRAARLQTLLIAFILLLVSFAVIVQASLYKARFSNKTPQIGLCTSSVPALYGSYYNVTSFGDLAFTRPDPSLQVGLDAKCDAAVPGTFYATYNYNRDVTTPLGAYDVAVCKESFAAGGGLCPSAKQKTFCPCISVSATDPCRTIECLSAGGTNLAPGAYGAPAACKPFAASTIGGCFCLDKLTNLISSGGVRAVSEYVINSPNDKCSPFFKNFATAQSLTYAATFGVVVINTVMTSALKFLTVREMHSSFDGAAGSLMFKIFACTFIDMAFVSLVAFGYIASMPDAAKQAHIFSGSYTDFNSAWYGNVGYLLVLTWFIQAATWRLGDLIGFHITYPLARCLNYTSIQDQASRSVARQDQLNAMELGPEFDVCAATSQVMLLLFVAMTFAAGLPVLMPLACVFFLYYYIVDKTLLMRFNERPPVIGIGITRSVLRSLPYACIIRLAFSCWMYGNPDILPSGVANVGISLGGNSLSTASYAAWLLRHDANVGPPDHLLARGARSEGQRVPAVRAAADHPLREAGAQAVARAAVLLDDEARGVAVPLHVHPPQEGAHLERGRARDGERLRAAGAERRPSTRDGPLYRGLFQVYEEQGAAQILPAEELRLLLLLQAQGAAADQRRGGRGVDGGGERHLHHQAEAVVEHCQSRRGNPRQVREETHVRDSHGKWVLQLQS